MATKKRDRATNAAIVGAGATTAGVGAVAGGVPGAKGNVKPVMDWRDTRKGKSKPKQAASVVVPGVRGGKAGILGWRVNAHQGGTYGFKQKATLGEWYPSQDPKEAFKQGRHRGKVEPEERVIRHMKGGKKAAAAAVLGGAAAVGYGHERSKIRKRSQRDRERRNGTLIGVGGAGLGISGAGGTVLRRQERNWRRTAIKNEDAAAKLLPTIKGKTDKDMIRQPEVFRGANPEKARQAGIHRGAATQQHHFADVYRTTGKVVRAHRIPSAAAIAVGAGGLAVNDKRKKKVSKAQRLMSDAELRRRKKLQGRISQTTSTLGLAGVATGIGAIAATKGKGAPARLKAIQKIPGHKNITAEQLKDRGLYTSLASGGIGGVGGYNFAAYTNAESRKRNLAQPKKIKKSNESAFGVVHE